MLFVKAAHKCTLELISYDDLNLVALKATEIFYRKMILEALNVLPLPLGQLPNTKSQDSVLTGSFSSLFPRYSFSQTKVIPLKQIDHVTSAPIDPAVLLKILP